MSNRRGNHRSAKGVITKDRIELQSIDSLIPDVETLEKLESLAPGATREWMDLAKAEIKERHINERRIVRSFSITGILGAVSGIVVPLAIVGAGVYAIILGEATAGAWIITGSVAQAIAAYGFRSRRKK